MKRKSNNKGQIIIEVLLMMIVFTAITTAIVDFFKEEEVVRGLVSGPWRALSGMMQNGEWGTPEDTMLAHPSNFDNNASSEGVRVQ